MRTSTFLAPLLFAVPSLAQGVKEGIEPSASAPAGCTKDVKGNFTIGVENFFAPKSKRESAQEAADGALLCTLKDGILRDQYSRTGSIVANQQFQFDGPPQAGAIYTGGFSVCKNNSLAIGGSTRWWRCMSGEFGNLYDESIGDQCTEIRIVVDMLDKPTPSSSLVLPSSTAVGATSIGGSGASRSPSATASPSGASSASSNSTASDASSASASSHAATSASGSTSGSATGSASRSPSPTGTGAAPPAGEGGAPASSTSARGVVFAAFLAVLSAALVL